MDPRVPGKVGMGIEVITDIIQHNLRYRQSLRRASVPSVGHLKISGFRIRTETAYYYVETHFGTRKSFE